MPLPSKERIDTADLSREETIELVVRELLTCENCERKNSNAEELGTQRGDPFVVKIGFECEYCGFNNRNSAELPG